MFTVRRVATSTTVVLRAALAGALVAGLTIASQASPAAAAQEPLFASDFTDGLAGWRVVTGAASEWTEVHDGLDYVTIDTRNQTSGRYLTVDPRLDLPAAYEIRTRFRIDGIADGNSRPFNVIFDWADPAQLTQNNMAAQITASGGILMAQPLAGAALCSGPGPLLESAQWHDLVVRRAAGIVAVEIDGDRVAAVNARNGSGTVGIGVFRAKTAVDRVEVDALGEVPPDHPTQATGCNWSAPGTAEPKVVLVNQSGYDLDGAKRFTAPLAADGTPYTIVDADDEVRFRGTVQGGVGDFTAFRPPATENAGWSRFRQASSAGPYRAVVGGDESFDFGIGPAWMFRVSYARAVDFMTGTRCYFGDAAASDRGWNTPRCNWSVMWRDGDTYSFEIPSLIDLYRANPSAFDDLRLDGAVYAGLRYQLPADTPEVVRLIEWGVEMLLTNRVNHTMWKEQLAAFLAAYPELDRWIPRGLYEEARDYLFPIWGDPSHNRFTSIYDYTPHTADLFQTYTQIGTGKGEFPPGHSIRPNLDMYHVALREGRSDAGRYLDAARRNAEWIVNNLDWQDPRTTKGQRQDERITVTGLVDFLDRHPDLAPDGIRQKIEDWAQVMIGRSDNIWDFRKYSADRWTIPVFSGGASDDPNETGNVAGFAAAALAAASVLDDGGDVEQAAAHRLRQLATAHIDNIFGRNPTGRHASFRATTSTWGFEGADLGWYSELPGGAGILQGVPGVLDGSPKNAHYPFHPEVGNIGHSEGWVSFNTAWNDSLAWLAADGTDLMATDPDQQHRIGAVQLGSSFGVRLRAPLDLDYGSVETGTVIVSASNGDSYELQVTERSANDLVFTGTVRTAGGPVDPADDVIQARPGDQITVSYGLGSFTKQAKVTVAAAGQGQ
jgi:hypothetical protein